MDESCREELDGADLAGLARQLDLAVGVGYATPIKEALALVREILAANPKVLKEPPPVIGVTLLGDSSVTIAIKPWVSIDDFVAVGPEINQAILERFRARQIEIPFPQREIRLLNGSNTTSEISVRAEPSRV